MTNFKNTYGQKTTGSTLTADEWNNLMGDLDDSIQTTESQETEEVTPISSSSLNDQDLVANVASDLSQELGTGTTLATTNNSPRGAVARLGLTASNLAASKATQLASVTKSGDTLVETVYGDRVRFGSWYIATKTQTEFGCSHEFLEIVNSGSIDVDMSNIKLGMITSAGTVASIALTGGIKARSSYLIRGKKVGDDTSSIQIDNYDIDISGTLLWKGISFYNVQAFVLYWKDMTFDLEHLYIKTDAYAVNPYMVDFLIPNKSNVGKLSYNSTTMFGTNPGYSQVANAIVKDLYSLDPAKQAYRSLTVCSAEASNQRSLKVQQETIPLGNSKVSFPHSKPKQPITKYAPKSSGEAKNILTDKTSPDFTKPNMVTCSFGINAATTRCFNWFSMSRDDEYVWIRKQGDRTWNKFESYKSGDGTTSIQTDTNTTSMHRKEFHQDIVNAVYKRMDNTFPGNDTYTYRVHKCIVFIHAAITAGNEPIVYEYTVGKANTDGSPLKTKCSDIQTFTLYPADWTPKVYHVTDQQGFGWMEYQMWAAAPEEINNRILEECNETTMLFPILINTGDMTQNGTRVNEWMDYYNAGYSLFSHIEQMNVVGNNDLCNSYSENALGIGDDPGKSNPYYFHVFYCYEIPNNVTVPTGTSWEGPLIYNGKYIPSMYYFSFGSFAYLMVNSELTETTCNIYYNAKNDSNIINLYTGYEQNTEKIYTPKAGYLGDTLKTWIESFTGTTYFMAACHEMPFTVTTKDNLIQSAAASKDRSLDYKSSSLVGSHLNTLGSSWANDCNYWFSALLQNKEIKICIGGHKHTYAVTYPIADVYQKSGDTTNYYLTDSITVSDAVKTRITTLNNLSKSSVIKASSLLNNADECPLSFWNADSSLSCGVVYFMLQATGYKQTSNKELPSKYQTYSKIVPDTTWKTATDGTNSGTADVSQQYPMYGTYEYVTSGTPYIKANIFRVVNITNETITESTKKYAIVTFSETANSSNTMYSEKLLYLPTYGSSTTNPYPNYWLVPDEYKTVCPSFSDGALKTYQRCYIDSDVLKGFVNASGVTDLQTLNTEDSSTDYCTMKINL